MKVAGKMIGIIGEGGEEKIYVSHVTVRQSIFLLLLKLVTLEAMATGAVVFAYLFMSSTETISETFGANYGLYSILLFLIFIAGKMFVVIFVIIWWLYDYYEITPKEIRHKRGLFFVREERHTLAHLGSVNIDQDIFGRVFNYGSLNLFNWVLEKDATLYLIHNPMKYLQILKNLIPESDEARRVLREHIVEKEIV